MVASVRKRTHEQYVKELKSVHGNKIRVVDKYASSNDLLEHQCSCGFTFSVLPYSLLKAKHGCRKCAALEKGKKFQKTPKQYVKEVASTGLKLKPIEDYIGANKRILHKCLVCKHEWKTTPSNVLINKQGCPQCKASQNGERCRKSHDQYIQQVSDTHGNAIKILGRYTTARTAIEHECANCQRVWSAIPDSILAGHGCPGCSHRKMKEYRKGRHTFHVQGFEDRALDWIFSNTNVKPKDVIVASSGKVPDIVYEMNGKTCRHKPDIAVPKLNVIVEVKSVTTFGLVKSNLAEGKPIRLFKRNCAKAKSAIAQGIDYRMFLMTSKGERIKLPKRWYEMSYKQIKEIL